MSIVGSVLVPRFAIPELPRAEVWGIVPLVMRGLTTVFTHSQMTRVVNMLLACGTLLLAFMAEAGCHSALSGAAQRVSHGPVTLREVLIDSIAVIWFVGAVSVNAGRRFGWIPSLIGSGTTAAFLGLLAVGLWTAYLSHTGKEQLAGVILGSVQFGGCCAVCVAVFIGLILIRRELR
jgi:hypothetical protein